MLLLVLALVGLWAAGAGWLGRPERAGAVAEQPVPVAPCNASTPAEDDCLSETGQRAWSSPIFVDFAGR